MRPTIPLAQWRLAIDLEATHSVNALDALPARRCACTDCQAWAVAYGTALPPTLNAELRRIGIDPARPSDVYRSAEATEAGPLVLRVSYHCVGCILSGPSEFRRDPQSGNGRNYMRHPSGVTGVGVAVAYQEHLGQLPWEDDTMRPLIAIDLWLEVSQAAPSREAAV
jgi:hypothetical protein